MDAYGKGGDDKRHTVCRICSAHCALVVERTPGGGFSVHGDKENPVFHGFSCLKGRESFNVLNLPSRLLHSQRRLPDGGWQRADWRVACTEIGDRLHAIVSEHGPRSVAVYLGTYAFFSLTGFCSAMALVEAIGSPMIFHSGTIDQPGRVIAYALHGVWLPGTPDSDSWEAAVFVGTNPLITMNGGLGPNPARKMRELRNRGAKIVVIDPRRTETARQADVFLQCRPGTDAEILAGIIRVLITEGVIDSEFIAAETIRLAELTEHVMPFTPERVARIAGIAPEELVAAARAISSARRGVVAGGTGVNMSGQSTLAEYLIAVLTTVLGWRPRAGDRKANGGILIEPFPPIAASPGPFPAKDVGEPMRVRGLAQSAAGMPTAALVDEILTPGEGQVKALIVVGGNPVAAFPDQAKTQQAMRALDLLVCVDPKMSATAREAHYVLAPKIAPEVWGCTAVDEWFGVFGDMGFGYDQPYAQVTPPVVPPPDGADLAEDWEFCYEIARRMKLQPAIKPISMLDPARSAAAATPLDMTSKPDTCDIWRMILKGAPVSFDEVAKDPRGRLFAGRMVEVQPKPDGWEGKLDIASSAMMEELAALAAKIEDRAEPGRWTLICRRLQDFINSSWHDNPRQQRRWAYNPAFMHPADIAALDAVAGDVVSVSSMHGRVKAVLQPDDSVRRGCVSMSHCWGAASSEDEDPRVDGASTSRLVANDAEFDRYSGIPRMSGISVDLQIVERGAAEPESR